MFQTQHEVNRRQGNNALGRFDYIQRLVSEYQNSKVLGDQQQVLGNICNFAYDPINYEHLRALNVIPDLFLDSLTEDDTSLIQFGLGGIANCCSDTVNAILIIENDGISSICLFLSHSDYNIVLNTLTALVSLLDSSHSYTDLILQKLEKDITQSVLSCIKKFTTSELIVLKNLAFICLEYYSEIFHSATKSLETI